MKHLGRKIKISEDYRRKISHLTLANEGLEAKNQELSREVAGQTCEISNLQNRLKFLQRENEIMADKFAKDKAQLKKQLHKGRDQAYASMKKLERMKQTHVPKKIKSLNLLLDEASLGELLDASKLLQKYIENSTRQLQEEKREAEIAKRHAEDQNLCVICRDSPITHSFRPCCHFCVCQKCASKVHSLEKRCPICRQHINAVERTFAV